MNHLETPQGKKLFKKFLKKYSGKSSQKVYRSEVNQFFNWYECLVMGRNTQEGEWNEQTERSKLHADYLEFMARNKRKGFHLSQIPFGREVKQMCPDLKIGKLRGFAGNGSRPNAYCFPSLDECRKQFQEQIKIKIDWENDF